MTVEEILARIDALAATGVAPKDDSNGVGIRQTRVKLGDLRALAKQVRADHQTALALWATAIPEARMVAILLIKPKSLSTDEMERLVSEVTLLQEADWLNSYVLKNHPDKEVLRQRWMESRDPMLARAAWSLTNERITKAPEGLDPAALLDRIEADMPAAPAAVQWTMNFCLAAIGINLPAYRARALAIGEALGLYRDYPVSRGCTSPFAPVWIREMVSRQG